MNLARAGRMLGVQLKGAVSIASRRSGSASRLLMRSAPVATQLLSIAVSKPSGLLGMSIGAVTLDEECEKGEVEEPR
jgi:hypothetical protein